MSVAEQHARHFAIDLPRLPDRAQRRSYLPLRLFGSSLLLEVPRLGAMGLGKPGIDFDRPLGGGKRVLLPP